MMPAAVGLGLRLHRDPGPVTVTVTGRGALRVRRTVPFEFFSPPPARCLLRLVPPGGNFNFIPQADPPGRSNRRRANNAKRPLPCGHAAAGRRSA